MLAVIKVTKHPDSRARKATLVIDDLRFGARALNPPIIIPIEVGLANPQIAKVAIADERSCG